MANNENLIPIPGRLHSVATEGHVAGANEIYDDSLQKDQATINQEVQEAIGTGGSVDTKIANAINTLDSEKAQTAGGDGLALSVTEVDGKIASISGSIAPNTYDANGAAATAKTEVIGGATSSGNTLKKLEDRVSPLETAVGSGGSIDTRISNAVAAEATARANAVSAEALRAQAAEQLLQEQYDALTQSDIVVGALPASGTKNLIYRVPGTNSYSDYMWNGTQFVKMAEYDNATDDEPTADSNNLVKSGGVAERFNNCLYNNAFAFNSSKTNESRIKLIKNKKYRIYFLTTSWNISEITSGFTVAYIDRYLNGSNVENIFIRRTSSPTLPEYFDFTAKENDYYSIGFRGNENERVYYYIDFEQIDDQIYGLRSTLGQETGKDFISSIKRTILPGAWRNIPTEFTLKANVKYTIDLRFDSVVSNSAIELLNSSGQSVFSKYGISGENALVTVELSADTVISQIRIVLNTSESFVTFDFSIYSGEEKPVIELIEEIKNEIGGIDLSLEQETGKDFLYYTEKIIPSGGWQTIPAEFVLKANIKYTLRFYFGESVSNSAIELLKSNNQVVFSQYSISGETLTASVEVSSDTTIAKIKMVLNGSESYILFKCLLNSGEEKTIYQLTEENRSIIEGLSERRIVYCTDSLVPYGGWHDKNTEVVLKAGVEYFFSGYFNENLTNSYFYLLDSSNNPLCNIQFSGYKAESTFKPSSDITNPKIRVSLNGQGSNVEYTAVIAINADTEVEIPKFPYLYSDFETFNTAVNGAFFAKSLVTDRIDATPSNIYGVHESNIYVYNGKIYTVYGANKIDSSEDHTKYNIELTRLSLDGTIENSQSVAAVGQTICGSEIVGCQAPFILGIEDNIHIYCDLHIDNGRLQIVHTIYSITNDTFSNWELVSYIDENGSDVNAINPNEQYICSSWFAYSGHNYCTSVFFNKKNCGIVYTDDFKTFNFIARIEVPFMGSGGEITAQYSSQVNKIIVAYRTIHHCPFLIMQQYDVQSASWEEQRFIPDSTARPMMFVFDGVLYLANNAPYSRYNVTVWRYMPRGAWSYWGLIEPLEVAKLPYECTYFSFYVYNNEIYMASIQQGLTKIAVSKIPLESFGKQAINEKLIELFTSI